ncbi:MAG: CotH kinase family protein [Chitinophagaceae bacterium]
MFKLLLPIVFIFFACTTWAQSLYDINTITKIEIQFSMSNWDYQMDTAKHGNGNYLMADWVKINNIQYDSVGIKYKGNSSFDSTYKKNPLHIRLDKFKSQKYDGHEDIKLSNGYGDPSEIREVLGYQILQNYMHCPKANFAEVYINGSYIGMYSSAEDINKKFLGDHFYSSGNTFIKCNPTVVPGPTTKSNFKFVSANIVGYSLFYELKSDTGWNSLLELCQKITYDTIYLPSKLDIDRAIWMLAFNNLFVNLDSYSGVFAQNHYTYLDHTQHFNPIVWDLNMCFGAFPFAGANLNSMGTQTVASSKNLSPYLHANDSYWPLIQAILSNQSFKKKYIAHMKTMLDEFISNGLYQSLATQYQNAIDAKIQADSNRLFSYTDFTNAMNTDIPFGSYTVPGIYNLMEGRKTYLNTLNEFGPVQPSISNIAILGALNWGSTLPIQVTINNANTAYIGYRFNPTDKFSYLTLYDVAIIMMVWLMIKYKNSVVLNGTHMEYYFYAENTNAGKFSPERAEHEFYTLQANSSQPTPGDIVINEFLADNVGMERDEYNNTEDWLELYNTSSNVLDLSNCYLSDNTGNPLKWKFPNTTAIAPHSYLTVWIDDDSAELILHTNFSLNKDTGFISLYVQNTLLDSLHYGAQQSNYSYGRYPNGTGNFIFMNRTYGAENNNYPLNTPSVISSKINIYPNPCDEKINIQCEHEALFSLYTIEGQLLKSVQIRQNGSINTSTLPNGIYFLKSRYKTEKIKVLH